MRFLCDHMLVRLGKWLRAAGYDTEIAGPTQSDEDILNQAKQQSRLLLTRDRHFLEIMDANDPVCFLSGNTLSDCVQELTSIKHINWLMAPFSRCLNCNTILSAAKEAVRQQIPPDVLKNSPSVWWCQHCNKAYWEGSHTNRMRLQLATWQIK